MGVSQRMKRMLLALGTLLLLLSPPGPSLAAAPYEGYIYSYWTEATPSPEAYLPARLISGRTLGIGDWNNPQDLYVTRDGHIYVLDSGNSRIVVLDSGWNVVRQITGFTKGGAEERFNLPEGLFVTEQGHLYVADTENRRLVELDEHGRFVREIGAPESEVLKDGFQYFPRKVAVDRAGRIFVVARGVYEGIIELDPDGEFMGFMGTNRVTVDPWEYMWKRLATRAQREQLVRFIPTEFNNLDLDPDGFLYATNQEKNTPRPIQKLNPSGNDVLRREGYGPPRGDLQFAYRGEFSGSSLLIDVDVNDYGVYSVLDSNRGRIFTYNEDGSLLYVFGKIGKQFGTFKSPVALDRVGENIAVLDRDMGQITLFQPTRFGELVNEANRLYSIGQHDASAEVWKEVLKYDANYEMAYVGVGKALLREGKNKEALGYLKLGYDRKYYSKAFERYRKEVLREHFGAIMTGLVALAVGWAVLLAVWKYRKRRLKANAA